MLLKELGHCEVMTSYCIKYSQEYNIVKKTVLTQGSPFFKSHKGNQEGPTVTQILIAFQKPCLQILLTYDCYAHTTEIRSDNLQTEKSKRK